MSKQKPYSARLITLLGVTAVFIIGIGVVHLKQCPVQAKSCDSTTPISTETSIELAPSYFTYSDQTLQYAREQGKVVLYFWAPWCGSCTSLDLELQENKQQVPEGVTVLRIEYDKYPELQTKYGVTVQHTFVQIDNKDEKLSLWVGGELENFERHLK